MSSLINATTVGVVSRQLVGNCLTDAHMRLTGSPFEHALQRYLYPILTSLGIVGNLLNLTVLLTMRNRSNSLLATLAFADILFLTMIIPHSMANFDAIAFNYLFRRIYFQFKMNLITFANWSSAAAIWLVIAVCTERLIGIRWPLHTRNDSSAKQTSLLIFIIATVTGTLTFYNHLSYDCIIREYCNGTQIYSRCFDVTSKEWYGNKTNPHSEVLKSYIKWSTHANAVFVVILPIILLICLNAMLILALKQRSNQLMMSKDDSIRHSDQLAHQKTEFKVTMTVCAIVTSFTLTQGPSAIVAMMLTAVDNKTGSTPTNGTTTAGGWYHVMTATSCLVVLGKTLNFILFCLSSVNFRNRLKMLIRKRLRKKLNRFHNIPTISLTTAVTTNHCNSSKSSGRSSMVSLKPRTGSTASALANSLNNNTSEAQKLLKLRQQQRSAIVIINNTNVTANSSVSLIDKKMADFIEKNNNRKRHSSQSR